jgi:hypothetical protein
LKCASLEKHPFSESEEVKITNAQLYAALCAGNAFLYLVDFEW